MEPPVTDYINRTETLVDFAISKLSASTNWNTFKLPGMNQTVLIDMLPGLKLPVASVSHESSSYDNFPRREATISVVICVDATDPNAEFTARDLCDQAISRLDGQVHEHALFRIRYYSPCFSDPGVIMHKLVFIVKDH